MDSIMVIPLIAFGLAIGILWYELHSLRKDLASLKYMTNLELKNCKNEINLRASSFQATSIEKMAFATKESHEALLEHLKLKQVDVPTAIIFIEKEN